MRGLGGRSLSPYKVPTSGSLAQLKDLSDCDGLGVCFLRERVKSAGGGAGGAWGMCTPRSVCGSVWGVCVWGGVWGYV